MYSLLKKMQSGEYKVDTEIIREEYKVVQPKLDSSLDFMALGLYIGRECAPRQGGTYRLERLNPEVTIRSKR